MSRLPIKLSTLLHRDRLVIALCPGQIGVVRQQGNLAQRKPSPERGVIEVPNAEAGPLWQPAVDILTRWLEESGIKQASVTLVLSNRFARFALVPWSAQVHRPEEEAALTRARFENQYGDMSGWTLQLDPGSYGESRVACAVETVLLDALRLLLAARQIKHYTLQPYFVTCWNRQGISDRKADALFATAEFGGVVLASLKAGHWHSIRALQSEIGPQSLQALLERESLLQGFVEAPPAWVHAPDVRKSDVLDWPRQMQCVEPGVIVREPALAVALSGVVQ